MKFHSSVFTVQLSSFDFCYSAHFFTDQLSQRDRIAFEVLTTEETYVTGLKIILKEFPQPLITAIPKNSKAQEELRKFFSHVKEIFLLHVKLFLALVERIQNWRDGGEILGDIFLNYVCFVR